MSNIKYINALDSYIKSEVLNNTYHIYLYGVIGSETLNYADILAETKDEIEKYDNIILHINSPGGEVNEGFSIYDYFARYRSKLTTVVEGNANSIASVIALSGSKMLMSPSSDFMIHLPACRDLYGTEYDLDNVKKQLAKIKDKLINIYDSKVKKGYENLLEKVKAETWFSASEAIDYGFADDYYLSNSSIAPVSIVNFSNLEEDKLELILKNKREKEYSLMAEKFNKKHKEQIENMKKELDMLEKVAEGESKIVNAEEPKTEEQLVAEDEPKTEEQLVSEEMPEEEVEKPVMEEMPKEEEPVMEEGMDEPVSEGSVDKDMLMELIDILSDENGMISGEELVQMLQEENQMVALKKAFNLTKEKLINKTKEVKVDNIKVKSITASSVKEQPKLENGRKIDFNSLPKYTDTYSVFK